MLSDRRAVKGSRRKTEEGPFGPSLWRLRRVNYLPIGPPALACTPPEAWAIGPAKAGAAAKERRRMSNDIQKCTGGDIENCTTWLVFEVGVLSPGGRRSRPRGLKTPATIGTVKRAGPDREGRP